MPITTTMRRLLAGPAAARALPPFARPQTPPHPRLPPSSPGPRAFARAWGGPQPRLTAISHWSAGSVGAAITALAKKFEEKGGVWQLSLVPGSPTEMMNKLRAQIIAGDPPACSQLKGPEI